MIHQLAWHAWIWLGLLTLVKLSIKLTMSYIVLVNMNPNEKPSNQLILFIYLFWVFVVCLDFTGTIFGYVLSNKKYTYWQAFFYGTWKIFAILSLSLIIIIVYKVYNSIVNILKNQFNRTSNIDKYNDIIYAKLRTKYLMIFLSLLNIALLTNAIIEYIWFIEDWLFSANIDVGSKFDEPPTIIVILLYLPIFSFVNIFILIYTWIPKSKINIPNALTEMIPTATTTTS